MKLFRRKNVTKNQPDIQRIRLQVEMVESLLKNGYNWDQIFKEIGFSETWLDFSRSILEKHNK